jgi:hypothetical protein
MGVIRITQKVQEKLDEIKKRNGHQSYDSVIRYLLEKSGEGLNMGLCDFEWSGHICRIKMFKGGVDQRCDEEKWWLCKLRTEYLQSRREKTKAGEQA